MQAAKRARMIKTSDGCRSPRPPCHGCVEGRHGGVMPRRTTHCRPGRNACCATALALCRQPCAVAIRQHRNEFSGEFCPLHACAGLQLPRSCARLQVGNLCVDFSVDQHADQKDCSTERKEIRQKVTPEKREKNLTHHSREEENSQTSTKPCQQQTRPCTQTPLLFGSGSTCHPVSYLRNEYIQNVKRESHLLHLYIEFY